MNTERFEERHRRTPYFMWPGVIVALPAIGCVWYSALHAEGTIGNAVVMLVFLFAYAIGWLMTALLGMPAALYSLYLERNAPHRLPSHTVARTGVALAFFSILTILRDVIGLIQDVAR